MNCKEMTGQSPSIVSGGYQVPSVRALMRSYDRFLNKEISFEEFEVIAKNISLTLRSENRALKHEVRDFINRARQNAHRVIQGAENTLDYNYSSDVLDIDRRVQINNTRFGFSEPNPSDMAEA